MKSLYQQHCKNQNQSDRLSTDMLTPLLEQADNWILSPNHEHIQKTYNFDNYEQTAAFVNAVIDIAGQQDHHPEISFSYNRCSISYSTHSAGGLTMNDFICAARIDNLNT